MAEYTPGPWIAKQSATDARHWSVGLLGKYHVHGCGDVNEEGETPYMLMSGICSYKDAHLIASAPELLEALQEAREALHFHYVEWDGEPEDAVPLQLARSKCDAAIAKATDEEG